MTPDGIRSEDWDRVHELAVQIVNAADDQDSDRLTAELLAYLDQLEASYGPLPSIFATRADYVAEPKDSQALLERAFELAQQREDHQNMVYVATSLAALQVKHFRNAAQAERWLGAVKAGLEHTGDESDIREYEELVESLGQLRNQDEETQKRG